MKLITKEIEEQFKKYPLYSQDGKGKDAKVIMKLFNPAGAESWYITEGNPIISEDGTKDYEMFGFSYFGVPSNAEFGYLRLSELENLTLPYGLKIERDMYLPKGTSLGKALERDWIDVPSFLNKDNSKSSDDKKKLLETDSFILYKDNKGYDFAYEIENKSNDTLSFSFPDREDKLEVQKWIGLFDDQKDFVDSILKDDYDLEHLPLLADKEVDL